MANLSDILDLEGWEVLGTEKTSSGFIIIKAQCNSVPEHCPKCNNAGVLKRYGTLKITLKDLPVRGKTIIVTDRQRYICPVCHKTFFQNLPGISENFRATQRLIDEIGKRAVKETFQAVADSLFVDHKTVRTIFEAKIKELEKSYVYQTPAWLGIDEIHIGGKPRCILTNVDAKTVYDLLPRRNKEDILKRLWSIKDKDKVKFVTMDMWAPYRDITREIFPHAHIVVDKFHVLRMANACLETIRKNIRLSLSSANRIRLMRDRTVLLKRNKTLSFKQKIILDVWLKNFPSLKSAYDLKESFYEIWDLETKIEALEAYNQWKLKIPAEMISVFKSIVTALKNWEKEVFAYFDYPITNAYTESMNNLIRKIDRKGSGYSFRTIRAKILYGYGLDITKEDIMVLVSAAYTGKGVDIDLLTQIIDFDKTPISTHTFRQMVGRKIEESTTEDDNYE